jgi:hypothetical protein
VTTYRDRGPDRDPLDLLRALNPVPAGQLDDSVWSPPARALFARIVASDPVAPGTGVRLPPPDSRAPVRGGRRRRAARSAAVLATLSVGVAGYALVAGDSSKSVDPACFAGADLAADVAVVNADRRGAVAACADAWAAGAFGAPATPQLRACLLESGAVGVFPEAPGEDVCLALGLSAAPGEDGVAPRTPQPGAERPSSGDPAEEQQRFLAFRDAVVARFLDQGCLGAERATAVVRQELDRAGLEGWTVDVGGGAFTDGRPCASLSFRPEQRMVVLVALPG